MKKAPTKWLLIVFILSAAAFAATLYFTDPRQGTFAIALFLGSLFLAIASAFTLIAFSFRRLIHKFEQSSSELTASAREGFLVALYLLALVGLSGIKLLTWWDAVLLALSLILFEVYFSSGKEQT